MFAAKRGEPMDAPHLTIALLDQHDAETAQTLAAAGIDSAALRKVALRILGAPPDLAPARMPPLTAAGTMDRPPFDVADLHPRAWRVLTWRQDHLPLDRVRRASDADALASVEQRAAGQIADQAGVNDDQRYSLLAHHRRAVDQRLLRSRPELVESRRSPRLGGMVVTGVIYDRRLRRRSTLPRLMVGWPTWFGNRRRGLQERWFRATTRSAFRGQPQLDS